MLCANIATSMVSVFLAGQVQLAQPAVGELAHGFDFLGRHRPVRA